MELGGARTYLSVPLLKDDKVMGTIAIYRPEVRPFTEKQVELVKTFARQAVIAIENVRLFNETKARRSSSNPRPAGSSRDVVSPTDVQPVLDAVLLQRRSPTRCV